MNRGHSEEINGANGGVATPGGTGAGGNGSGTDGGSKRKRVSLACNACRLRKSKCDGVRPKCCMCRGMCGNSFSFYIPPVRRGKGGSKIHIYYTQTIDGANPPPPPHHADLDFDCVYQQSASSANTIVSKDYIGQLETRLLAVENLLAAQASLNQQLRNATTPGSSGSSGGGAEEERESRSESNESARLKRKRDESLVSSVPESGSGEMFVSVRQGHLQDDTPAPETVLDGMGNLGDEDDYGYFGPSSNVAFIGHVTRALATCVTVAGALQKDLRRPEPSDVQSRPLSPRPSNPDGAGEFDTQPGKVNPYVIPTEAKARHYIALYFQNTNVLYPYLHQPTFIETYEAALKDNFTKVRRTWLALLNLVMSMGSRASTEKDVSTEEKYKTAETFFQRGYALCNEHLLRLASLDAVHLLLLMSHYLQSTRKPVQCWTTHGLAIRVAIQLGLHSTQALQRFPPLERELRKRAWYGCPPAACTSTTFFIVSITLYTLLGRIIDTLYGGNLGGTDPSEPSFTDVARIAEIEEKLAKWRENLPAALQIVSAADIPEGGGPPSQFWRQSIILSLRYHNTRALLHRQFAVKGLSEIWGGGPSSNRFEGDFFWNFGLASIKACSDSAIETVEIIHKVKYRSDLLGFWWFTLYYTFNASLVLVSRVLIVSQVRQLAQHRRDFVLETPGLLRHLEMAMETLEVLATGNRIANRCRMFLKNLMRYVAPLAASSPRTLQLNPPLIFDRTFMPEPPSNHHHHEQQHQAYEPQLKSPFRAQLGEFMLESDFSYLHSILPPLGMADLGMEGYADGGAAAAAAAAFADAEGGLGGFGA
ncbi:fungal-specific transcription factor domain-containing protein [Sphaerosporella brunnea]|uniref:Fungal-specific transcription factor domain-containing protein n=1 Tax=Sphaerosporella brunnea TaxID=1250544 RepID=A0A5J5EUT4_9PEZI|nr:fungal-specific transcription factor domain-containing protein [Sphaerosporella brunnea]